MTQNKEKHYETILKKYLQNEGRFSVLILGERGTGKSRYVEKYSKEKDDKSKSVSERKVIPVNCAAFADDTTAESDLFGHAKGAFTSAVTDHKGYFREADKGVLFFDEVHTLTPRVQHKLMLALQTEGEGENQGKFRIQGLKETKATFVKVQPVFASNWDIDRLRKELLPDFYDRISQLIVEIPSIQESGADLIEEFHKVWQEMKFIDADKKEKRPPKFKPLYQWLKSISLDGNYRTLQTIAIIWNQGTQMGMSDKEVFEDVKRQYTRYHSSSHAKDDGLSYNFRKGATKLELLKEYRKALYHWAQKAYGSNKEAQDALQFKRLDSLLR